MAKRITQNKRARKDVKTASGWDECVKEFMVYLNGPAEAARYTIDHYQRNLDRFRAWWDADPTRKGVMLDLPGLVGSDLKDFREFLRSETVGEGTARPRQRKAATVNTILAAVKSLLAWAVEAGVITEAPMAPKRVRSARPTYKAVPIPDQKRLLRAVERGKSERDMAIVLVLLDGGLRVAELCSLLWRDVKLLRGSSEIYVWHGKGDKQRTVALSSRARLALVAHAGKTPVPDAPVFKSRKGSARLTPRGVQDVLTKYARPLGMHISPHQLRHSFATDALARGNQIPAVQATLGHRSAATTLLYATSSPEDLRRVVERESQDGSE